MKQLLQLEELAQFGASIVGLYYFGAHFPWWAWAPLFLSPDLSALGYLISPSIGGLTYNLAHHKAIALAVVVTGFFLNQQGLLTAGLLLYGHSSMDRIVGYGLKYPDNFKHTHLGWLPSKGGHPLPVESAK